MDISFLGHASFLLKTKTKSLVTDPFDPKMLGLRFPKVEAEIVTVSHDHPDHNQASLVSGVEKVIFGPGEYEIGGVSIIGIDTFHDDVKGKERGKNTIYIIEMEDLRLLHLGDLGHKLSEKQLDEIGEIDVLMIPVGGEYTIGPKIATEVTQGIEPKIIIPMHYQMPSLSETFSKLTSPDEFVSQMGLKTQKTKKLKVSKGSLSTDEQIIFLLEK